MKTVTRLVTGFTAAAALSAIGAFPGVANATNFRTSPAIQCVPDDWSSVNPVQGGMYLYGGLSTAVHLYCPLMNDTYLQLNTSTAPTVHLNGYFDGDTVETCVVKDDGTGVTCGTSQVPTEGYDKVSLDTSEFYGRGSYDGYFIYVSHPGTGVESSELFSYDIE